MRIAAVYVTYAPDIEFLRQSMSLVAPQVDHIYIVDNSEVTPEELFELSDNNCTVLSCGGNTGIANALNIGYTAALKSHFDWVLSLDQDSVVPDNIISIYIRNLQVGDNKHIGALVPAFHLCPDASIISGTVAGEVTDYMTSGSLVNLKAFQTVNGFEEKLFIDMVDTDFGLKLIDNGLKIIRIPEVVLTHNIGNATEIKLFGKHIGFITHHNHKRRYYITRNVLYLSQKYGNRFPEFGHPYFKILKSLIRLILFEKQKTLKLKSVVQGISDYRNNRYGKF